LVWDASKTFGKQLHELGNEVMIVDEKEETLQDMLQYSLSAQIGDCTNEEVLRSLGVNNFDICFVCVGTNFQSSLEITSLLKELGAKRVISKASRVIHQIFLLRNGADEVIDPEREVAERLAMRCSSNHLFDYFELSNEVSIYEIPVADLWVGKSIRELDFRVKYHLSILATRTNGHLASMPPADHILTAEEHLIVMGHTEDVDKVLNMIK
jgi:trk system potassium uptake protein TrkA